MAFCTKCGAKLEENSKFCANCGKPVNKDENEESSCEFKIDYMEIIKVFEKMIISPISSIRRLPKEISKTSTVAISVLIPILVGLMSIVFNKVMVMSFKRFFSDLITLGNSSISDNIRRIPTDDTGIEIFKNFISSGLLFMLFLGVIFLIFYISKYMSKVKEDINLRELWNVILFCSIPMLCGYLIGLIVVSLSFISFVMIMLIGTFLSVITLYEGVNSFSSKLNRNIYYFAFSLTISLLIMQKILVDMLK